MRVHRLSQCPGQGELSLRLLQSGYHSQGNSLFPALFALLQV